MLFSGKVVWITGASSGIGAELARQLSARGALLILTARNEPAMLALAAGFVNGSCHVLPADLTETRSLEALTEEAVSVFGRIDAVIHGAGVSQRSLAESTGMEVYRQLMEINFFAPVAITRALLPHFRKRGSGHIVVLSSMAGLMGFPLRTGYAAAKHAVKGFFETLQTEHSIPGLHITLVFPGRIRTSISVAALTGDGTPHGQLDKGQREGIPVRQCADKIIRGMAGNKKRVVIARGERILWWLWFLIPGAYFRIARRKGLEP
jgi:short-subunit dehydrogenase